MTRIESVYPNPFNPQTTVLLAMRQAGRASVKVYDVRAVHPDGVDHQRMSLVK